MAKDPRRKGKLRSHKPVVDDELLELASVLAEYQLDNNAYGWFRPAWRDGECAISLAKCVAVDPKIKDWINPDIIGGACFLINSGRRDGAAYETAGQLYNQIVQPRINTTSALLIAVALRCLQLKIANSHGNGTAYNELLLPVFLSIEPALVEQHVLEFRCNDAIGTTHHLRGDHNDRKRSAFAIAWKRGLYLAAYSISPAFDAKFTIERKDTRGRTKPD
jgi:hypothetical protein